LNGSSLTRENGPSISGAALKENRKEKIPGKKDYVGASDMQRNALSGHGRGERLKKGDRFADPRSNYES